MIVCIGDVHAPFIAKNVFTWILDEVIAPNSQKIGAIVQLGDLYDLVSYAKFPKRLLLTPREEMTQARLCAEEFWDSIIKRTPNAKRFQLMGNHDERLIKRLIEKAPEFEHLSNHNEYWKFPKVRTVNDSKEELKIQDWIFLHGHRKFGDHIKEVDFQNVAHGHLHRGQHTTIRINRLKPKFIEELDVGYIANPFDEALLYRPLRKFFGWTWGVGVIDQYGGRFIKYPHPK